MDPLCMDYHPGVTLQDSNWFPRIFSQLWSDDLGCPATSLSDTDLVFRCPDGYIAAHKVLLQLSCRNVADILSQRKTCCHCSEDVVNFVVPDVSIDTVQKFLEFLYTGSIRLETQDQFRDVQEFGCNLLGFFNLPETKIFEKASPHKRIRRKLENPKIENPKFEHSNFEHSNFEDSNFDRSNFDRSESSTSMFENDDTDDDVFDDSYAQNAYGSPSNPKPLLKCPQCSHAFFNASSLYMHATLVHYRKQLAVMFKSEFERNSGVCSIGGHQCKQLKSLQAYLQHMGGKHKAIHTFMSPEVLAEYTRLPTRTYVASGNLSSSSSNEKRVIINCVICQNPSRSFGSISEYKQHLAIYHFRKEIANSYLNGVGSNSEEFCFLCASQPGSHNKEPKKYRYLSLLVHLGSKHNCILDFAGSPLMEQLQSFNVFRQ